MADGDYIIINRKILQWRWFKNGNTLRVFFYCLLKANWKDGVFEDVKIPRGSFVSSVAKISEEVGLTVKETRTALNHLKRTNELAITTTPRFSVITVNNYCLYQIEGKDTGKLGANQGQTEGKLGANQGQTEGKQRATIEEGNKGIREEGNNEKKEEENPLKEKVIEKEIPKENMEQMYQRVSVDYNLSEPLYDKLGEWFKYKQERRQTYKESGMRSLLKKAVNSSHEYGDMAVCDLIDFSMQSNYQGIFWERLTHTSKKSLAERWRDA